VGSTDAPLGERGAAEARALRPVLAALRPARRLVSPLQRAVRTAELALPDGCGGVEIQDDLREVDFGDWECKTFAEISSGWPEEVSQWAAFGPDFAFPGGERLSSFLGRVEETADRLAADPAETIAVFTHGGVIRAMICHFLGLAASSYVLFSVAPATVATLELFDGRGVLTAMGVRAVQETS